MLLQMTLFHSFYDIYTCVYVYTHTHTHTHTHIYHNLFTHSSIDGHLVCFHVLVVVNSDAFEH